MDENNTQSTGETSTPHATQPKGMSRGLSLLLGILIVVVLLFGGWYGYARKSVARLSMTPFTLTSAKFFHLPIATVDGKKILYADYVFDLNVLNTFYKNPVPGYPTATPEQISDQVLTRLVGNILLDTLARQYDVTVDESDLQPAIDQMLSQFNGDKAEAEKAVQERFGIDFQTYIDRAVTPLVLEQKIQTALESSNTPVEGVDSEEQVHARHILFRLEEGDDVDEVRAKAQGVLDRAKNGEDFETLAKEFGSDATAENGGDLGWFPRGMMVPEFEDVAFELQAGQVASELAQTTFGYHIIKVDERKNVALVGDVLTNLLTNSDIAIHASIHNPFATSDTGDQTGSDVVIDTTEPAVDQVSGE